MKLTEVMDNNVVSLLPKLAAQRRKNIKSVVSKVSAAREQHFHDMREASRELVDLEQQINDVKKTSRLPGFETLSDVFYYLVIEARFPTHTTPTVEWFDKQPASVQSRIKMIASHAPRIGKAFNQIRAKLREFQDKWVQTLTSQLSDEKDKEILDGAVYLDTEIQTDAELLKSVVTLVEQVK